MLLLLAACATDPAPAPEPPPPPPPAAAPAPPPPSADRLAAHLLDLRADYPAAVGRDASVRDPAAYARQREVAAAAVAQVDALALSKEARRAVGRLDKLVAAPAPPAQVAAAVADALARLQAEAALDLSWPDGSRLAQGPALWSAHCASCHGPAGAAPTGAAPALAQADIAVDLSPQRVFLALPHGGLAPLPRADAWAVAFHAAALASPPGDAAVDGPVPPLEHLATTDNAALGLPDDLPRFAFLRGPAPRRAAQDPAYRARQALRRQARDGGPLAALDSALDDLPTPLALPEEKRAALSSDDPAVRAAAALPLLDRLLPAPR